MNEFFDWVMYFMYSRFSVVVWNMQTWCCSTTGPVVRAWQNMHTFTLTATRKSCFKTLILSIYFIFMFDDFPKSARVCIKFPSHSLARSASPCIYNVNALYLYRLHFSALHHIHLQTICWMCACESSRNWGLTKLPNVYWIPYFPYDWSSSKLESVYPLKCITTQMLR